MKKKSQKNQIKTGEELAFSIIAADIVLWTIYDGQLLVRLIPVNILPYIVNKAGLPGGLIQPTETADETVKRLIKEKARIRISSVYIEQLYTFSDINRDPRGRVVAVGYSGYVPWRKLSTAEQENTEQAWWNGLNKLPELAYDHNQIIKEAIDRLQSRVTYTNLIAKLMDEKFTLTELQSSYELVLGKLLDKRNFRKKLIGMNVIKETQKKKTGGKFRPAKLYTFRSQKITQINMI